MTVTLVHTSPPDSFPPAAFDTTVPIGTVMIIDNEDPCIVTDLVRVPGGWVMRTFVQGDDALDGYSGVAQTFISLPTEQGRG